MMNLTPELHWLLLASATISAFIFGILLGGFVEWDKRGGSRELRRELRFTYEETEALRQALYEARK